MTTTLPPKSLARRLRVAEALNHLMVVLSAANADYWNQTDDALIAEMNADIAETMEQFQGNSEIAPVLNAWQERLAVTDANGNRVYSARVPTERGRLDIGFDNGAFFIIPPPLDPEEPATQEP